jgi:hypothetical protein
MHLEHAWHRGAEANDLSRFRQARPDMAQIPLLMAVH